MKSALSDFISGKKGIYGILHIIILVMSLFLVISISVDTFKGIPFYTQSSYMKVQLCICLWFLFDFVLEFFLAKHKGRYLRTHFIFLLVAIPYHLSSPFHTFIERRICACHCGRLVDLQSCFEFVCLLSDDVVGNGLFFQSGIFCA